MVALVMLVIIGFASVSVMRGALNSDLVANNTRVQTLANQAAQIALAYCERLLADNNSGVSVLAKLHQTDDDEPAFFNTLNHWSDDNVYEVPDDWIASDASTFTPDWLPQCMVEQLQDTDRGDQQFAITARGFSPDYDEEDGAPISGSVVWLQSRLLY